nr:uncharacterized protein LOC111413255 [Onthophagus taurus]
MGVNHNYFRTLSGALKPFQLAFNFVIIMILVLSRVPGWHNHLPQPLLQLSITNAVFGIIILIIRLAQNDRNANNLLGKVEFGIFVVSTYLYISFASLLIPVGWLEFNVAMVFGYLLSMLYAADAFDKFVHFVGRDNEPTYHQRFPPAPSQINPPHVYPQGFTVANPKH